MQFDSLGASGPGMKHFMLDFHLPRKHGELSDGRRLLEVNAIVNRDARLEARQPNERVARVAAEALQLRDTLLGGPRGPGLSPKEKETGEQRQNQNDERGGEWTPEAQMRFAGRGNILRQLHQPKKVPPPTPEGHEGRLFPPEQSFKSEVPINDLTSARKQNFRAKR